MGTLFLTLGSDHGALDIVQLVLTSVHYAQRYTDLEDLPVEPALEAVSLFQLVSLLGIFAEAGLRLARSMISEDRRVKAKRKDTQKALDEIQEHEGQRLAVLKARTGSEYESGRSTGAKIAQIFARDQERLISELESLRQENEDVLAELRWLRKRVLVTLAVATRVRPKVAEEEWLEEQARAGTAQTHDTGKSREAEGSAERGDAVCRSARRLESAIAVLMCAELQPDSKWKVVRVLGDIQGFSASPSRTTTGGVTSPPSAYSRTTSGAERLRTPDSILRAALLVEAPSGSRVGTPDSMRLVNQKSGQRIG